MNPWDNDPVVGGKTTSPEEFSMVYGPVAERIGKAIGVDPKIVLGQLGLETGWGKSIIPGTNNLGNIKDFAGGGVSAKDNMTGSRDKYRAYATPEDFADDYSSLIQRKYPDAVGAGTDASKFTAGLKGYAEDPRYPTKVAAAAKIAGTAPAATQPAATGNPWDNDPIVDPAQVAATPATSTAAPKREKTGAETAINLIAKYTSPLGGLVDAATGGKASIGAIRGVKDVIDTGAGLLSKLGGADEAARVQAMNQEGKKDFADTYGDSTAANVGRVAGQAVATVPLTNFVGAGAAAAGLPRLGSAIASGGMTTGAKVAPGLASGAADLGIRTAGGALSGGLSAGAVDPSSALKGAEIGAAMPTVVKGLGAAGSAVGRTLRGPDVPANVLEAAAQARDVGYVIPPTQARPTLTNRLLEGFSGKITTAQNASARNQEITNDLAKRAINAPELTPEGLSAVRAQANKAYSDLGNAGQIVTDDAFRKTLAQAGERNGKFAADFPELVKKDVDTLIENLANKKDFDAQSAIEAIKRLREGQRAGLKAFDDAEKKAYAKVQGQAADAIESLVERNLEKTGQVDLLEKFRAARQTLAKTYDIEKALNPASGNVDANKLAQLLKKGRPLSSELKSIAEFSSSFPKATQTPERMGSLPQTSPLDWAAMGIGSATTGNPLMMAGVLARPAARSAVLSSMVQNKLGQQPNRLMQLSQDDLSLLAPLYRGAPLTASSQSGK